MWLGSNRGYSTSQAALADWAARSTAPGVVQAIRFNNSANVTNWTHPDENTDLVTWNQTDGIIGDGCMQINQPTTLNGNGGQWRIPLNASWTSGGGQSQGFGTGVDWYVQFRCKFGPNRLQPSINGGGNKTCIIGGYTFASPSSSHSDIDCEFVITNPSWQSYPFFYHHADGQIVDQGSIWQPDAPPPYDTYGHVIQTAVDHGASFTDPAQRYSLYEDETTPRSPGVVLYSEGVWYTHYFHFNIALYEDTVTNPSNTAQMWFTPYGTTTYQPLFTCTGFAQASGSDPGQSDDAPNGPQALWLLPYDTNRSGSVYNTYQSYDQVIVSTQPIACPLV